MTIPTVVDTSVYIPSEPHNREDRKKVIGWMGSSSTWNYVLPIVLALRTVVREGDVLVRIIGAADSIQIAAFEFLEWSKESDLTELRGMHVGIMPLPNVPWSRGKCGYKLIQYMACGLPVVASPVGVNREIVEHGVNGFLAETLEEWEWALRTLLANSSLRAQMGQAGRRKVEGGPKVYRIL